MSYAPRLAGRSRVPSLTPEGNYPATLIRIDPPRQSVSGRHWLVGFWFLLSTPESERRHCHSVLGFLPGLALLRSCEEELKARTWTVRIEHLIIQMDDDQRTVARSTAIDGPKSDSV